MFCNNKGCAVVEHLDEYCPVCKQDEDGQDWTDDDYESRCDSIAANQFEDWAHGGKQDDWDDDRSDPIVRNDAGEPLGYC